MREGESGFTLIGRQDGAVKRMWSAETAGLSADEWSGSEKQL